MNTLHTSVFTNHLKDKYTQLEKAISKALVRSLKHLCQAKIKIFSLPVNPFLSTTSMEAVINRVSEFILCTAKLHNSMPVEPYARIDCHLHCLNNGMITMCSMEKMRAGEHSVGYIPTIHGRHNLTISVEGQPVAGSPFPVMVCIPPAFLGKPVKVWGGLTKPWGVTVNSMGDIVVTEFKGDIMVFSKGGTRLATIKSSVYKFECLQGVAIDREDNIYFVDKCISNILKSDRNCSNVQLHRVEQLKIRDTTVLQLLEMK